ncbi:FMN-binding negative transcriptional regulator [Sporosarcina sp. ACRSL]|uniref:FMN-binding negative transcriptional regulator n=1 Tax=Sporosarcina sp. ACRSL TaxID=2918215 RepID=UPI001EF3F54C|nr:FMN-binding negative transcriptional regulator [Sporosarcina sp. ACRSL]MCG7342584.1 FMN-binding negative transcriptional regulator [Sporosarcina sp. ACRSL]
MFIPKYFKVSSVDEVWDFIQENSFGILITTEKGKPIATHLPLQLMKEGETYFLTGHMANANPQWKTLEDENVLVIFQGPHAYISSSWYDHENVPTWNYQAVHVYGAASVLSEEELEKDLAFLLQKYEHHREGAVLWETLSTQTKKQIKGIVGFKIKVQEVQAAYKLSQNRNDEDYNNIIDKLNEEEDCNSRQMAKVMKNRKS